MPDELLEYRQQLRDATPSFLLPRKFTSDDKWTGATVSGGPRYHSIFREHQPDLAAILAHRRIVILGEPGAGKSTIAHAIVQHVLDAAGATGLPLLAGLKHYGGSLQPLFKAPEQAFITPGLTKTFILDGVDEIPADYRDAFVQEVLDLAQTDPTANIILTARQAFYRHHQHTFPAEFPVYHLLDFTEEDVRACARHHEVNVDDFLAAVRNADCDEEIHNPFVLLAVLQRFKQQGQLSPLRSDNVGYMLSRLIESRPLVNAARQRRALRMLAVACETAARNTLTEEEALRVLLEAMTIKRETAEQILDELSHSILIKTPGTISFQMRSYGEYLAAEELHHESVDRLRELAFINNAPVDTWLNAISYLAEMSDSVRAYFGIHHPEWLINVSPRAFTEAERTTLTRTLVGQINETQGYIVNQRGISRWRLARLLTPAVIAELNAQLDSPQEHEQANALALLGILKQADIVPRALALATAHRNASSLRYSAITALVNAGNETILDDLIAFAQTDDPYHLSLVDAIGALCTPADFPRVLPILEQSNAGLSATHMHFRELRTKEALTAALEYLTARPGALNGYGLDAYLEPIINLIPEHWDATIATQIGTLLATLARAHYHDGQLAEKIVQHAAPHDTDGTVIQTMITALSTDGTRARSINHIITPLITPTTAQWIKVNAPAHGNDIAAWLPEGAAREILAPITPEQRAAQERFLAEHRAREAAREQSITNTREEHQHTIKTSREIDRVINAAAKLQREHWPPVADAQRSWLETAVNDKLEVLDLGTTIRWISENQWQQPQGLQPLLNLIDHYALTLTNDVPLILALRAWPERGISNYVKNHGLSAAARDELLELLQSTDSIANNVLSFLRETQVDDPELHNIIQTIAADTNRRAQIRIDAINRLPNTPAATARLAPLASDTDEAVRAMAFRELVTRQHRPTISHAIATLTNEQLRQGERSIPESTPLDWISNIKTPDVIDELRALRLRTLQLNLWRSASLCTGAIATIDTTRAVSIIRQQLRQTPAEWRDHLRQEADTLERQARIAAAQNAPFDDIIRRLKGATSMISVRVWCEGSTDRPIVRKLLRDAGEEELARTVGLIGGWGNLLAEREPEQYLSGCREAVIIMDGDNGRRLRLPTQPYTAEAKEIFRRFKGHNLTLHVLRRYGIENYFPRHACEAVLGRDLSTYFPIPHHAKAEEHFRDPRSRWPRWLERWCKRKPIPFYRKELNEKVATYITMADLGGTDLADAIQDITRKVEQSRQY